MEFLTVLGFDFGLKQIGVAVGQTVSNNATAIGVVAYRNNSADWAQIDFFVKKWCPNAFVVGMPLHMDGSEQSFQPQLKGFANSLEQRYQRKLYWVDERLTTVAAKEQLFEEGGKRMLTKANIDAKSAEIILQQWMRAR